MAMKNVFLAIGLIVLSWVSFGQSTLLRVPYVFYGESNLQSWSSAPLFALNILPSVGVQLDSGLGHYLEKSTESSIDFLLLSSNLETTFGLCSGEVLASKRKIGQCSGFVVAQDYLITAAHCLKNTCDHTFWAMGLTDDNFSHFPKENIRECERVVYYSDDLKQDLAVVQLKKLPNGSIQKNAELSVGLVTIGDTLSAIGSVLGSSLQYIDSGEVLEVLPEYYVTNLDLFSASSGAPVINKTGVVGMVLGGNQDLEWNILNKCFQVIRMDKKDGGEVIIPSKNIYKVLDKLGISL